MATLQRAELDAAGRLERTAGVERAALKLVHACVKLLLGQKDGLTSLVSAVLEAHVLRESARGAATHATGLNGGQQALDGHVRRLVKVERRAVDTVHLAG